MKKSDYNRVLSLLIHTDVSTETCVKLIVEICKGDPEESAKWIMLFLKETIPF